MGAGKHSRDKRMSLALNNISPTIPIIGKEAVDISRLEEFCFSSEDPYMASPTYIAITGRKGLSAYKGNYGRILYAEHPNMKDTCIFFPPIHKNGYFDVKDLKKSLCEKWKHFQIIRVPEKIADYAAVITKGKVKTENVLDYKYPVYTISGQQLMSMSGPLLYNFKKTLNKLERRAVRTEEIDFSKHKASIFFILESFQKNSVQNYSADFEAPYLYLFNNLRENADLKGQIFFYQGKPAGFNIWETNSHNMFANDIAHCALHIQGLSEYIHFSMARKLAEENIDKICIGGSETLGLDRFKRKMNPVECVQLKTIDL